MVFLTFTADQFSMYLLMSHLCTLEAQMAEWILRSAKQAQWHLPGCLVTSELHRVCQIEADSLEINHKTEGWKGRKGISAWRNHTGLQRTQQHPTMPWRVFSLCCCSWENHSWVPTCSSCLTCTSHVISNREKMSKKKKRKKRQKTHPQTKLKNNPTKQQKKPTLHSGKTYMQRTSRCWWQMHKVIAETEEGYGSTGLDNFQHAIVISFYFFPVSLCDDDYLISVITKGVFLGHVFLITARV